MRAGLLYRTGYTTYSDLKSCCKIQIEGCSAGVGGLLNQSHMHTTSLIVEVLLEVEIQDSDLRATTFFQSEALLEDVAVACLPPVRAGTGNFIRDKMFLRSEESCWKIYGV